MSYASFIIRRLLSAIPVIIGVVVFTFILMRQLPGDPAIFFATSPTPTAEEIASIREKLGLDRSLLEQLFLYFKSILSGDLGSSMTTGRPVLSDLFERLPASMELTFFALAIALAISIPLGVAAARRQGSVVDHIARIISTLGVSLPTFVTGLLLIYVFFFLLSWAPEPIDRIDIFITPPPRVTGFLLVDSIFDGNGEAFFSALSRLVLPGATMAIFVLSPLTRMTRAAMIGVLTSDFIRTAQAAGLKWWTINIRYALRNAFIPILTTIGLVFSFLLGANVLVERVFAWPGIGSYALKALVGSDYAPVQGYVLLMGALYVGVNLLIDLIYGLIDPRMSVA